METSKFRPLSSFLYLHAGRSTPSPPLLAEQTTFLFLAQYLGKKDDLPSPFAPHSFFPTLNLFSSFPQKRWAALLPGSFLHHYAPLSHGIDQRLYNADSSTPFFHLNPLPTSCRHSAQKNR